MRIKQWVCVMAVVAFPAVAQADFTIAASVGKGLLVSPSFEVQPSTLMVSPGYALFGDILRFELGLVAALPDVKNGMFDLQVRPMAILSPPLVPLYLRAIFAAAELLRQPSIHYGAALGVAFSIAGLGVFAEAGGFPRPVSSQLHWTIEARAGAVYKF